MAPLIHLSLLAMIVVGAPMVSAQPQPELQLYGEPFWDGQVVASVIAPNSVGSLVWLGIGFDPLPLNAPIPTAKGPFYIGMLADAFPLGNVPAAGTLDLPFTMPPPIPGFDGVHLVAQALVAGSLSNPASIAFDIPYYDLANASVHSPPAPSPGANFGDRIAVGDLNDDGIADIAVGAWFEDTNGKDRSGRAYVLWGPDFSQTATIDPPIILELGFFGSEVVVADVTNDGVDDLLVGEPAAFSVVPSDPAQVHIYEGGASFSTTPSTSIPALGVGVQYGVYGRNMITADLNNDQALDIVAPVWNASVGNDTGIGRIDVFWGPAFSSVTSVSNPDANPGDFFGTELTVGDTNGDGVLDLIEGSGRADAGGTLNAGEVHVFLGPALTFSHTISYPLPPSSNAQFGEDLASADMDGDQLFDIITASDTDHLFVFWGGNPGAPVIRTRPPLSTPSPPGASHYGDHLAVADVNQDGYLDILASDTFDGSLSCPNVNEGMLHIALGPYFATHYTLGAGFAACGDAFAWEVKPVDLDGISGVELVIGIPASDVGAFNAGQIAIAKP